MGDQVDVHGSNQVLRTDEIKERLPGQVADIEKTELAVANDDSRRARIFVWITRSRRMVWTGSIHCTCIRKWSFERCAGGADDDRFYILQWQTLSRFRL